MKTPFLHPLTGDLVYVEIPKGYAIKMRHTLEEYDWVYNFHSDKMIAVKGHIVYSTMIGQNVDAEFILILSPIQ